MNESESSFTAYFVHSTSKVSKAQLARQNITVQTSDGQARRILVLCTKYAVFGYWSCVCRYRGGMNRLQAFQQNAGEPQEQYKGASEIKEASGWRTPGVRQRKRRTYGVPVAVGQVHSSDESSESCRSEGAWLLQFYTMITTRKGYDWK